MAAIRVSAVIAVDSRPLLRTVMVIAAVGESTQSSTRCKLPRPE